MIYIKYYINKLCMNIVSFDFRSAYDVPIPRPIVKQPKPPRQPRQPKEKTSTENSTYYSRNKARIRQYYLNKYINILLM